LTDKTGTLTLNELTFCKLAVGRQLCGETPAGNDRAAESQTAPTHTNSADVLPLDAAFSDALRSQPEAVGLCMRNMALCHSVTVLLPKSGSGSGSEIKHLATSPEEEELLKAAGSVGVQLLPSALGNVEDVKADGSPLDMACRQLSSCLQVPVESVSGELDLSVVVKQTKIAERTSNVSFEAGEEKTAGARVGGVGLLPQEAGEIALQPALRQVRLCVHGVTEVWGILHELPYTSARRRMTVVAQSPTGHVWLFAKGADDVMFARAAPRRAPGRSSENSAVRLPATQPQIFALEPTPEIPSLGKTEPAIDEVLLAAKKAGEVCVYVYIFVSVRD
jgi:magnesium-transporting ATPase (P-type)